MAEARTEDEEETVRESRGRNPRLSSSASERAERNKPEQRLSSSQGALTSIRAVIKRTSNRTTAQSDHNRERRRPEITILSAEPLPTNNWFPGASGAFPPAPPPAQPSWAASGLTVHLPPPSYEQVIREKSREQNTHSSAPPSSSSSSSSPTPRRSTVTIATQTDVGPSGPQHRTRPPSRRPPKPPRPSFPLSSKSAETAQKRCLTELEEPDATSNKQTPTTTHNSDSLSQPLAEHCGVQTDFSNVPSDLKLEEAAPTLTDSAHTTSDPALHPQVKVETSARPQPRPRSKAFMQPVIGEEILNEPMTREVKVQTLVRLKDDSAESIFAGFTDSSSDVSSNKYLQELLDAFGFDDIQGNQPSESDQSEEEEEIPSESRVPSSVPSEPLEPLKIPQPRPRSHHPKPVIAPKPSEPMQDVQEMGDPPEEKSKQAVNPPVPAPRPLLTNKTSEGNKEKSRPCLPPRPPVAARRSVVLTQTEEAPSGNPTAAVPPKPSVDNQNVDDQSRSFSSSPVMPSANSGSEKCSLDSTATPLPAKPPFQKRPPPPSYTSAQVAVGAANADKAQMSSVPSLPPREGKLLPLRPPPVKMHKSAGSSHAPAAANKLPAHKVPKRGPPLPPRPKPGHPLYRDYTSKVPQGNTKMNLSGPEPEECYLQQEEVLLVLDDTHTPTQTASSSGEVKVQGVSDDPAVRERSISEEMQNVKKEQQKEQQLQPNTDTRCEARFAFEGQEGELTFCEGDVITLIEYVHEEWGRGSVNGQTGLFPLNFVQDVPLTQASSVCVREKQTGRALFDFTPEDEDELCLKVGDIVSSLEELDEEWFVGEFGGIRGIVPKNYIQVL